LVELEGPIGDEEVPLGVKSRGGKKMAHARKARLGTLGAAAKILKKEGKKNREKDGKREHGIYRGTVVKFCHGPKENPFDIEPGRIGSRKNSEEEKGKSVGQKSWRRLQTKYAE